ncbi:MAG: hypothetical protein J1E39_05785 [Eubacterium sp.]|nr:hypothetical protein [Eubacterium sp.]
MNNTFTEMLLFQVKPEKTADFEALVETFKEEQARQEGCVGIRYFRRFYTFDGVDIDNGDPPRELTKIVKCVKYYAYWEFNTIENCGKANGWMFRNYYKDIVRLLIMPFDINSGYSL